MFWLQQKPFLPDVQSLSIALLFSLITPFIILWFQRPTVSRIDLSAVIAFQTSLKSDS